MKIDERSRNGTGHALNAAGAGRGSGSVQDGGRGVLSGRSRREKGKGGQQQQQPQQHHHHHHQPPQVTSNAGVWRGAPQRWIVGRRTAGGKRGFPRYENDATHSVRAGVMVYFRIALSQLAITTRSTRQPFSSTRQRAATSWRRSLQAMLSCGELEHVHHCCAWRADLGYVLPPGIQRRHAREAPSPAAACLLPHTSAV